MHRSSVQGYKISGATQTMILKNVLEKTLESKPQQSRILQKCSTT